jgi:HSP20 family molecular chaperone IbpA
MSVRRLLSAILIAVFILLFPTSALAWPPYPYMPPLDFAPPANMPLMAPATAMRVERSADPSHYTLTIHLSGIEPQAVQVTIENDRWIVIGSEASQQTERQDKAQDGRGFAHSYSYRSSHLSQRFSLPADADPQSLQRRDETGRISITFARQR